MSADSGKPDTQVGNHWRRTIAGVMFAACALSACATESTSGDVTLAREPDRTEAVPSETGPPPTTIAPSSSISPPSLSSAPAGWRSLDWSSGSWTLEGEPLATRPIVSSDGLARWTFESVEHAIAIADIVARGTIIGAGTWEVDDELMWHLAVFRPEQMLLGNANGDLLIFAGTGWIGPERRPVSTGPDAFLEQGDSVLLIGVQDDAAPSMFTPVSEVGQLRIGDVPRSDWAAQFAGLDRAGQDEELERLLERRLHGLADQPYDALLSGPPLPALTGEPVVVLESPTSDVGLYAATAGEGLCFAVASTEPAPEAFVECTTGDALESALSTVGAAFGAADVGNSRYVFGVVDVRTSAEPLGVAGFGESYASIGSGELSDEIRALFPASLHPGDVAVVLGEVDASS